LISYWTAYLKANYKPEYMAGLLTSVGDNKDKSAVYLSECRRLGVKVLPPDVNESMHQFAATGEDVRFGLGAIRNVGANVVESIIKTRQKKGRYTSFVDFLDKSELVVCNKRVIESLIKSGAFDSFGHTRLSLMQIHEEAVDAVVGLKRHEAMGQFDLFGGDDGGETDESTSPLAHLKITSDEWARKQLLSYEREMLGLYVSAHPLDGTERVLRKNAPRSIAEVKDSQQAEGEIVLAGMIASVERRVNKKGEPWAIITLEDLDASIEVLAFPKSYSVFSQDLIEDSVILIKGRVNIREDKMGVFCSDVAPLDVSAVSDDSDEHLPLVLLLNAERVTRETINDLKSALNGHKGETPVHVKVCMGRRQTLLSLKNHYITPSPSFFGEIKAMAGVTVDLA